MKLFNTFVFVLCFLSCHSGKGIADTETRKSSLYQVQAQFMDQDGRNLPFGSLQGQPVIITMFYASCPYACPVLLAKLKNLDHRLSSATQKSVRYLIISFDPERDKPAKLKKLTHDYKLEENRWHLVQASDKDIRLFAALLGINYRKLDDGEFSHNTVISLLDKNGIIDRQIDGQQNVSDEFLKRIEQIAQISIPVKK